MIPKGSFYKNRVLRNKKEFEILFSRGRRLNGKGIRMICYRDSEISTRVAVCVARSAGNAVRRNRLKRITRSILYTHLNQVKENGLYLAFLPQRSFESLGMKEREQEVIGLLQKAGAVG